MTIFRLAIIGGGINSAVGYTHIIASQMDHRFKLVAACFSKDDSTNKKTADTWGLQYIRLYKKWEELLKYEINKIDAVLILTPTPMHYEIVMHALSLNHSVICEKSLSCNQDEAENIYRLVKEKNSFLAVTYNYTGYPMLRELKNKIFLGKLGKLTQINIEMPQEGFARLDMKNQQVTPQAWRLKDGEIPSISLDLGIHLVHMIHFISGMNPIKIIADQNTFGLFNDIIDDVTAISYLPENIKVILWYGKSALGYRNGLRIRVFGTEGSAEWYQMEPEIVCMHDIHGNCYWIDRAADVEIACQARFNRFKSGHPAGFIEAFANVYVDIADALDSYKKYHTIDNNWTYGVRQAVSGLATLKKIHQSAKKYCWEYI